MGDLLRPTVRETSGIFLCITLTLEPGRKVEAYALGSASTCWRVELVSMPNSPCRINTWPGYLWAEIREPNSASVETASSVKRLPAQRGRRLVAPLIRSVSRYVSDCDRKDAICGSPIVASDIGSMQ